MARVASILIASGETSQQSAALAAAGNVTFILAKNRVFAFNADQDVTIAFGLSTGNHPTATVASYRIPANQQSVFDMGPMYDQISVFNLGTQNGTGGATGATAANIYVQPLVIA